MSATPLADRIRRLIEANGPMSVADYMMHCLTDPAHGYYAMRDPFGADGDFITAPEVSQMFGEILGAWLIEAWRLAGAPEPVLLVELGPGRGTLMTDILRVAQFVADFRGALSLHLVETSLVLRQRQAEFLARSGLVASWHESLQAVPQGPLFLIANEFFDALPIRQFVRSGNEWHERVIGLDAGKNLVFGIGPGRLDGPAAAEGAILELRPAADALMAEIAKRIVEHGGAALIVDYGHPETAFGDTLQAVSRHSFADPLAAPGEADLTAHVDFGALSRAASDEGAAVHGPMPQGAFLDSLGLRGRVAHLGASADETMRRSLHEAAERLAGSEQMGTLFKVLAVTRQSISPPPFPPAGI